MIGFCFLSIFFPKENDFSTEITQKLPKVFRISLQIKPKPTKALDGPDRRIGKPKWDVARAIPLPRAARAALAAVPAPERADGRYFPITCAGAAKIARRAELAGAAIWGAEDNPFGGFHLHLLRHSLNSNLILAGVPPILVASYLGWQHQNLSFIQQNYTHINARNLRDVAEAADRLLGF